MTIAVHTPGAVNLYVHGAITDAQSAVATAIDLHYLFESLAETGICEYRPSQEICGIDSGRINVCGLAWLAGKSRESGRSPLLTTARAFVDHGLSALHACVWC